MGRVYKPLRAKCWWIDYRDVDGKRVRRRVSESKKLAQEALREVERMRDRIRAGLETLRTNNVSIAEIYRDFRASLVADGLSPRTIEQYDLYVPGFVEAIGAAKVSDVTLEKADTYKVARRRAGISPRTVNIALQRAKRMLNWAVERDKTGSNPLKGLKLVKETPVHERRALKTGEIRKLLAASPLRLRRVWALFLCAGMRRNELVFLKWKDIDLDRRSIRLKAQRTKMRKPRLCFLGPRMVEVLREIGPGESDDYVFVNSAATPWRNNLLTRFRECCKAARIDLSGLDLHALRATFATLVMETGADLKTAQTLIGHGSATGVLLLDKYAKPRMLRLRETAAAAEELVFGTNYGQSARSAALEVRVG